MVYLAMYISSMVTGDMCLLNIEKLGRFTEKRPTHYKGRKIKVMQSEMKNIELYVKINGLYVIIYV